LHASGARKQAKPGFHLAEDSAPAASEAHIARQNKLVARATRRNLRRARIGCHNWYGQARCRSATFWQVRLLPQQD
jgi:hypothetical protein